MINLTQVDRLIEFVPDEIFLVRQAKSGDVRAFIKLYDAYIERVHRYVYLQVVDDRVAEGLAFQTFFNAWKQLNDFRATHLPFLSWLYLIAQNQVNDYYRTHKNNEVIVPDFLVSADHTVAELQTIREILQIFTVPERQALVLKFIVCMPIKNIALLMKLNEREIRSLQYHALQKLAGYLYLDGTEIKIKTKKFQRILAESQVKLLNETSTLDEQLIRFPQYATQLEPLLRTVLSLTSTRDVNPLPTFTAYTREALLHYMLSHPQRLQRNLTFSRRMSVGFAVLMAALLVTGTAQAQSALPGEPLYDWKRASEIVWRAISLDPVSTDIILAERRLDEWIALSNDPARSASARIGYVEVIARLRSTSNEETIPQIVPALRSQQQALNEAGLVSNELNSYLIQVPIPPAATLISIPPTEQRPTATAMPPMATEMASTETEVPSLITEIAPTDEEDFPPIATDIPPTETAVPTEAPTEVPTEVPTEAPTFIPAPTPTEEVGDSE